MLAIPVNEIKELINLNPQIGKTNNIATGGTLILENPLNPYITKNIAARRENIEVSIFMDEKPLTRSIAELNTKLIATKKETNPKDLSTFGACAGIRRLAIAKAPSTTITHIKNVI